MKLRIHNSLARISLENRDFHINSVYVWRGKEEAHNMLFMNPPSEPLAFLGLNFESKTLSAAYYFGCSCGGVQDWFIDAFEWQELEG